MRLPLHVPVHDVVLPGEITDFLSQFKENKTEESPSRYHSFPEQLVQLFNVVIDVIALNDDRRDKDHFVARDC